MCDSSDMELVRDYVRLNAEAAFAELVRRHINLVYSVAFRHAGMAAQAEEITQAVFIILARKAASLRPDIVLEGWLHETTRLATLSFLRGERRRQFREQEAYMQSTLQQSNDAALWQQLSPFLDEAVARLGKKDRDAVVLRFFKEKSVREVAAALQVNEPAAQRRILRALEKLRKFFAKRGVNSSTAIIAGMISANSVQAAPVALAKSVTAVAIAKGAAASISTLTLIKGALKIMAWTKAKTALVIGAAAILTVGTTSVVFHHNPAAIVDFVMFSKTQELSNDEDAQFAKWTGNTPEQAARNFFEACGQEDWQEVAKFWNEPGTPYPLNDKDQKLFGGLQIVSLGKPFWAWTRFGNKKIGGAFVPYEIRFKDGAVKKFQLQVRCDNPEKRWYVDGGL